ncbi:BlaR1 peptidase M56 [Aquimarina amphilecti]|uniref:BlaR1 peptidase M56 n=1 Tax=Aquimarina amphilecti TaxID=1038014 RepID=A0A1H7TLT9_AQUAM|nr:M23/M56 family metallopeptidase [Aquimarina amphilecti]SEL84807.1 BlaR1 peptidase M56 [Aquimarina amphilecti]
MSDFLTYLFQASICLATLYTSYYLFLKRLTFHKVNRIVLLLLIPFSLGLPLLNQIEFTVTTETITIPFFNELLPIDQPATEVVLPKKPRSEEKNYLTNLISLIYILGFFTALFRLSLSVIQLYRIKKKSNIFSKDGYRFVTTDTPHIFSSFGWIFIPKDKINEIATPIIEHEKAHIKLWHTADLILTEMYVVIFWFNPFSYFFRKSIRSVHEFQADSFVLNTQIKKSYYLELLINTLQTRQTKKLHSYFNHSLIKKRIDMITKTNSNQASIIRYALLLPIFIVLLTAFVQPKFDDKNIVENIIEEEVKVEIPPSIFPIENGSKDNITAVYGKIHKHPLSKKKVIHRGIDIRAKIGTPILATEDGTISVAKDKGNWGNLIVITHANGYETWYAHLDSFEVTENQKVSKGQIIGKSGNTGLSTGPHLHYEVRLNGKNMDPMDYLK